MFVFVCAGCGAELTDPLSQVPLPAHAHQSYGNGLQLPVLMESGTFAVEPEPWGPPWRTWEEIGPEEAAARGVHAPVRGLSDGAPGAIVIAPGELRGAVLVPEKRGGACCGLAHRDGPNMACEACGLLVATRIDDCSLWQAVWLAPDAVHRLPVDDGPADGEAADAGPLSWEKLSEEGHSTPPFEPITSWGSPHASSDPWSWSPQWEAAAGQALAHLLAASEGQPVTVPGGLAQDVFQHALDVLLPAGPVTRRAVLAGPELPAPDPDADILLVPVHPRTGRTWTPDGPARSAYPVPLPFGVWRWMAFPQPPLPVPTSGRVDKEMLDMLDDLSSPHSSRPFRFDATFERTLVRLPAVRNPWLRALYDRLTRRGGVPDF